MAYKHIIAVLTGADDPAPALGYAAALSEVHDAHLDALCLGVDNTPYTYTEIGANAALMQAAIETAHETADEIEASALSFLETGTVRWGVIKAVTSAPGMGRTVALQARLADLAVIGLPYGPDHQPAESAALEGLLFDAECPTIVVPHGAINARPKSVVIGWNESSEALRAVRAAMPILKSAKSVHVAIIDPPDHGPERSDPGGALAVYLSRHGIHCDIQVMSRQGEKVSARLARHVTETGSDMLVMGGYGHSRFREAVLGGATREMLEHSKVPVLMAH